MSQTIFFIYSHARFFTSPKEETYLAHKGASARALVAVACMVCVSVSYDVNVEPAKVVLTRSLSCFFFWRYGFFVFVFLVRSNFFFFTKGPINEN